MKELLFNPVFAVFITFGFFYVFRVIYSHYSYAFLNPVFLSIIALILFLKVFQIPYRDYFEGARIISFFLGPAVVALAVPLHEHMNEILRRKKAIILSIIISSILGVLSASGIAQLLGGSTPVVISIAPKSATAPIAIGISEKIGGIPPLTTAIVIATGVLGAVMGPWFLRICGIRSAVAFGLAMGAASHGIGTARALEEGELQGTVAGLAIALNGVATAVVTPFLIKIFH